MRTVQRCRSHEMGEEVKTFLAANGVEAEANISGDMICVQVDFADYHKAARLVEDLHAKWEAETAAIFADL